MQISVGVTMQFATRGWIVCEPRGSYVNHPSSYTSHPVSWGISWSYCDQALVIDDRGQIRPPETRIASRHFRSLVRFCHRVGKKKMGVLHRRLGDLWYLLVQHQSIEMIGCK